MTDEIAKAIKENESQMFKLIEVHDKETTSYLNEIENWRKEYKECWSIKERALLKCEELIDEIDELKRKLAKNNAN